MQRISVLSVEPYGMKLEVPEWGGAVYVHFSALGRAVWDETDKDKDDNT